MERSNQPSRPGGYPARQGLYHPKFEHDACGIGMLADIAGQKSHRLVEDAVEALNRLTHRGGVGSEAETGDGAGILIQLPHRFFARVAADENIALPGAGGYGVAMAFCSPHPPVGEASVERFCAIARREGLEVLWVRRVPVNPGSIGKTAAGVCPAIRQVFIRRPEGAGEMEFERALYLLSRLAAGEIRYTEEDPDRYFYLASCSGRTIVYKGMLLPNQLPAFYLDLMDRELETAIALVHSRFSTNTFPSWERAHPQRMLVHNGEINTIGGNVNWTRARQRVMHSPLLGDDLQRALPVIDEDGSDSAMLDDFIRLLVNAGYSLPHAMMMAVPEPYEKDETMGAARRAFYEYHNCLCEPWDGPAALAFTDGVVCGAMLDRNGLRPARYTVTGDGLLVLASETGVLPVEEGRVVRRGRLSPGQMLLVDTRQGRIIGDEELKEGVAGEKPYGEWLAKGLAALGDVAPDEKAETWRALSGRLRADRNAGIRVHSLLKSIEGGALEQAEEKTGGPALLQKEKLFGYTYEDLTLTLKGMAEAGEDPISSMGTDTPLAILSGRPQLLYNYFKQLFAQVTNPPIDAIREKAVTSSSALLGGEGNLLDPGADNCKMLKLDSPVLSPAEFRRVQRLQTRRNTPSGGLRSITLPILFEARAGALERALEDLFAAADIALLQGYNILVLSDEGAGAGYAPIPALLAVSGLHQHLVRRGTRTKASLVVAAGDARETHHLACLVGFGANAVCPLAAFEILADLAGRGMLEVDGETAQRNYTAAATASIVKIMSKMGISTLRSYHGAQIFEALGVGGQVVDRYFTGTVTRIGGLDLREIEAEALARHAAAFGPGGEAPLDSGGDYKWRRGGEYHLFNPENIFYLQQSCRAGDYALFKKYSAAVNKRSEQVKNIRGLLRIREAEKPLPLGEVESADSIVQRFKTGAMSYGSISREAHETLAVAMNRLGGKSNTGEGGEAEERFTPDANGDSRCSAIKQVASARFGVTIHYLANAQEIQIKMAQGAKPGEGGHLPGKKVYPWIAESRHATPGVELISPPPHHDIYSIEDLAQLIHDLKSANPEARVSVKLVSEAGVGTVAVGVAKGLADTIVVSGYDGGTGAAPRTSIRHAGLPWELGVAEAHQTLLLNGLRNRVRLETDGKLLTGRDIVIAALLGAEEFAFATAPLVVLGCDMMRVCNLDTCPVGIATQNPELRAKFAGRPEHIVNLMRFLAEEVREWMARIGVRRLDELIGHVELLRQAEHVSLEKAGTVDLSGLLYQPRVVDAAGQRYFTRPQDHHLEKEMDTAVLLPLCAPAIEEGRPVRYRLPITNQQRTVGCTLSGEIAKRHGADGLPGDTIRLDFEGAAGQSFGAFLAPGVTLRLEGEANDYLAKGLSGGKVIVSPRGGGATLPKGAAPSPDDVIAGNVAFFGATSGEGYIRGRAGERFCVRNSGAKVVVEGVGDNGCEYMTGGTVVVLGTAGRNFAAGMSGGVAYLYTPDGAAPAGVNRAKVGVCPAGETDEAALRALLEKHREATGSTLAAEALERMEGGEIPFHRVIPHDYQKVLLALEEAKKNALSAEESLLFAFNAVIRV